MLYSGRAISNSGFPAVFYSEGVTLLPKIKTKFVIIININMYN